MQHNFTLTDADMEWIQEHWDDPELQPEPGESLIIMTSIGYVELWSDGEVTAYGKLVGTVENQGQCVPCDYRED